MKFKTKFTFPLIFFSLFFTFFYATHSNADVTRTLSLSEAQKILRPTQYGRGGGNVKDMLARFLKEWGEKNGMKCNKEIGGFDLNYLMENLSQGDHSFVDFITEKSSKGKIPVFATYDKEGNEIYLQTDGHHRTSALIGEFLKNVTQGNSLRSYQYFAGLLQNIDCHTFFDQARIVNAKDLYQKEIKVVLEIKNKNSLGDNAGSLKEVIKEMVARGKILPKSENFNKWNHIKWQINHSSFLTPWNYLTDSSLATLLWGTNGTDGNKIEGILPATFDDLEDDALRSFMGNFMFSSNLDSKHLIDYVEFKKNDKGLLFGGKLFDICQSKHFTIFDKQQQAYVNVQIPAVITQENWKDRKIKAAVMACLFDRASGTSHLLTNWLKKETPRLPQEVPHGTGNYSQHEKHQKEVDLAYKRTEKMVNIAQIIWLLDDANFSAGDKNQEVCAIIMNSPLSFNLNPSRVFDLKNPKRCDSLIHIIKLDEQRQKMNELIQRYRTSLDSSNTYRSYNFVIELDERLEEISELIAHVVTLQDKQDKRLYQNYLYEKTLSFFKGYNELIQASKREMNASSLEVIKDSSLGDVVYKRDTTTIISLNSKDLETLDHDYFANTRMLYAIYQEFLTQEENIKEVVMKDIKDNALAKERYFPPKHISLEEKTEEDQIKRMRKLMKRKQHSVDF